MKYLINFYSQESAEKLFAEAKTEDDVFAALYRAVGDYTPSNKVQPIERAMAKAWKERRVSCSS